MTEEKELKDLSTEEIKKNLSVSTGINYALGIMLILLLAVSSYVVFIQGKTSMVALMVIPVALLPIFLINSKKQKEMKIELNQREN